VRDRIKAVLFHDKGCSSQQIAEAVLISDQAVRNHIKDFKAPQKLKPQNGGSEEKLSEAQSKKIRIPSTRTYLSLRQGYYSLRASDFWNFL
jgi:predicted ArsR family transcriptional regulator